VPDHIGVLLRRYRYCDLAINVVGVGSVGTQCLVLLLEGRDENDLFFLQIKEADRSVLEDHLPHSVYEQHGRRVVEGQRLIQASSDSFLGWQVGASGTHYHWRQFKDMKSSFEVEGATVRSVRRYARLCGWTLARALARLGIPQRSLGTLARRQGRDGCRPRRLRGGAICEKTLLRRSSGFRIGDSDTRSSGFEGSSLRCR
jgi:hypothetical protein